MHFNIYEVFYSQCFHQHVSAGIPGIFRVMLMLQEYKRTNSFKVSALLTTVSLFTTFRQPALH